MAAGFYIRIVTMDRDNLLNLEPLRSPRGKKEVITSFSMDKLRARAESALEKLGFRGVMCWACSEPGRRFEWTAEKWPEDMRDNGIVCLKRKRGRTFVVAEIVL